MQRELEILNEVARIATLDLEARPMLQRITDALASKFGWEFVALITIDHEHDAFVCEALTTIAETAVHVGYTRQLGSGVVGQVAETGEAIVIDDVLTWPNYIETLPGVRAEICVPVRHHGRIVAVLNLESTHRAAFHGQLRLLTGVADQIAGAIASGQLYAELQKVTAQLELKTRALEDANAHLGSAIETLHRISTQDGLTQLANRRHFDDTLAIEWRRAIRNGMPMSLLIIDVDHFKQYNDEHGHQAGDDALRRVAQVLRDVISRAADLVARYGGEEFAVLLPETDADHAMEIAELVCSSIELVGTTASIGVAIEIPSRDSTSETLVKRADEALYEAKRLGRNRVVRA
ncbi:MAG TPA: sensor domain-containing diguanylate cyclase [Thermoanaerobaculia bacterium]|jgi:diguanylate cyclase (GGDEF)-like protein|nr:sensor domain-containing diguanylate cyclase [Thermoanaerobaculia bacterium]